jgi:hypothetical protein
VTRVEVQAGIHNIFRGTPQYRAMVEPRDLRKHPQYNDASLINDIALIYVIRPMPLGAMMQRIALPRRANANDRFVRSMATVIGWGRTSDGEFYFLSYFICFCVES